MAAETKLLLRLSVMWVVLPVGSSIAFSSPELSRVAKASVHQKGDSHDYSTSLPLIGRRECLAALGSATTLVGCPAISTAEPLQDSLNIENFLRTGVDTGGNMGVSSQAGKSRPQTGVIFRDGSDVSQDKTGAVSAEILTGTKADPQAVLVSFVSPWELQTGPVFDVECRDGRTGDGVFLAVTQDTGGKSVSDLPTSFFFERLFDPTGRFSFYGPPTDIKVKRSRVEGASRYIELSFSNLSQSTSAEIPRKALLVATIPKGSNNVVMLVGSANASRWQKGAKDSIEQTVESFQVAVAPKTGLKVRAKQRGDLIEF